MTVLSAGLKAALPKRQFYRRRGSVPTPTFKLHPPGILLLVGFLRTERQTIQHRRSRIHWHTFSQNQLPPETRDELRVWVPRPIRDMERKIWS